MLIKVIDNTNQLHAIPHERITLLGKPNLEAITQGVGCHISLDIGVTIHAKEKFEDVCAAYDRATVRH